ncbi:hypothetical protein SRHO_G00019130 [Serrasalmus rhombeus]
MCVESFMAALVPLPAEMRIKLISSLMHDGALPCHCDHHGSLRTECDKVVGQCPSKPNVIGHNCDHCALRKYGFRPYGCTACDGYLDGLAGQRCDPSTCHRYVDGFYGNLVLAYPTAASGSLCYCRFSGRCDLFLALLLVAEDRGPAADERQRSGSDRGFQRSSGRTSARRSSTCRLSPRSHQCRMFSWCSWCSNNGRT